MKEVFIKNLKFRTIIGLLDHERKNEQEICVSAKFKADEFIDYVVICEILQADFNEHKFYKVEDALDFFEAKFKAQFRTLHSFSMKIAKPHIIDNALVGAKIKFKKKFKLT
jgi:dihydroneopterin aldolase